VRKGAAGGGAAALRAETLRAAVLRGAALQAAALRAVEPLGTAMRATAKRCCGRRCCRWRQFGGWRQPPPPPSLLASLPPPSYNGDGGSGELGATAAPMPPLRTLRREVALLSWRGRHGQVLAHQANRRPARQPPAAAVASALPTFQTRRH